MKRPKFLVEFAFTMLAIACAVMPVQAQQLPVQNQQLPIEAQPLPVQVQPLPLEAQQLPAPVQRMSIPAQQLPVENPVVTQPWYSTSQNNMVATVSPQATNAGIAALDNGGNAIDAAVAAALTLGVVDGYNSGIGGGCFILIHSADGKITAIDGRETAPACTHRDFYRNASGVLQPKDSRNGARAVAVPGALMAFEKALQLHGRKSLSQLIEPAAQIAEAGFEVTPLYHNKIKSELEQITQYPATARLLLKDSAPLAVGDILLQPDLANTYRSISTEGVDWFYNGPFAQKVDQWMKENGGGLSAQDFANYNTALREPIRTPYRGSYEIIGFPPPSSGGIHVAQILNILEHFDLAAIRRTDRVQSMHVIAEAMKLAFADRAFWPGDPKYVAVPKGLVRKDYACQLASCIDPFWHKKVHSHGQPPDPQDVFQDQHTTHIAAADKEGNWVAITSTINTTFGSKVVVPGTGVFLNNEMDDFAIAPGVPNAFDLIGADQNAIAAGKRPLSSMSPTIVLREGKPVMTLGAAGGPKIITQVANALINVIDFGFSTQQAIAQPRFHHQWSPDRIRVEATMSARDQSALTGYGHTLQVAGPNNVGVSQIISYDPASGIFTGAHDPRVPGMAAGSSTPVPVVNEVQIQPGAHPSAILIPPGNTE